MGYVQRPLVERLQRTDVGYEYHLGRYGGLRRHGGYGDSRDEYQRLGTAIHDDRLHAHAGQQYSHGGGKRY